MRLLLLRQPIPDQFDIARLKAGGGFRRSSHPPAGRCNTGCEPIFRITVPGGGICTGLPLAVTGNAGQPLSPVVHGLLAVPTVAAMLAHIYIGKAGMEGAWAPARSMPTRRRNITRCGWTRSWRRQARR
ncbi:hypothetical protein GCM10011504_14930 [Siccirubricoccus deserti]|nr:hypothetical protein GCM10011504_14930 [Siccirubricoccus deserti]